MGISLEEARAIALGGQVLRPRMKTLIGGIDPNQTQIPPKPTKTALFPKNVNIMRSNFFEHDRFKAVFALGDTQDYEFWADETGLSFNLELQYEGLTESILVFSGICDKVDFDLFRGEVTLSGRNLGSMMVNRQSLTRSWVNKSKEDIVKEICAAYGIEPDFGITGAPAGDFGVKVNDDQAHQALGAQSVDITDWDILARIAMQTGRTCYEKNGILFFHEKADHEIYTILAPTRTYESDGRVCHLGPSNSTALKFTHDYIVTNYNQTALTHINFHGPDHTTHRFPEDVSELAKTAPSHVQVVNRSDEDIAALLESYARIRNTREWHIEWTSTGPEMLNIDVVDFLEVEGTDSALDGLYQITSLEHNIHWERGLTTTINGEWGKATPDAVDPG